jgi:hypothetical protein
VAAGEGDDTSSFIPLNTLIPGMALAKAVVNRFCGSCSSAWFAPKKLDFNDINRSFIPPILPAKPLNWVNFLEMRP